jgi:hypothetical protein
MSTPTRAFDEDDDMSRGIITSDIGRVDNEHSKLPPRSPHPLISVAHIRHSPEATVAVVNKRRFFVSEINQERNKKRRQTAMSIDVMNIILPLKALVQFLDCNFCCKRCHKSLPVQSCDGDEALHLEVFGISCGINFRCNCGVHDSLCPDLVPLAKDKLKTLTDSNPYGTRVNTGDFILNR